MLCPSVNNQQGQLKDEAASRHIYLIHTYLSWGDKTLTITKGHNNNIDLSLLDIIIHLSGI